MRLHPFLLFGCSLLLVGVCKAETSTQHYPNGQKKLEVKYKDGKQHGVTTMWHENGQKKLEASFKDGNLHGMTTRWYENGQKEERGSYKDGKRQGRMTRWYENGQKKLEASYNDGKQLGGFGEWDENGNVKDETNSKASYLAAQNATLDKVASFPDRYMRKKVRFKGVKVHGDVKRYEHIDGKKFCVNLTSSRGAYFYGKASNLIITVSDHMAEAMMDDTRANEILLNCDVYCDISKIRKIGEMVPHAAVYMIITRRNDGGIHSIYYK